MTTVSKNIPNGYFSWTTNESDASNIPYTFTVTVKDDAAPIPGLQTRAYQILVRPSPKVQIFESDSACGFKAFSAIPVQGINMSYIWEVDKQIFSGNGTHTKQLRSGKTPLFIKCHQ